MAEVLILAFDTFGIDDAADRMAWKMGYVVDVKPDGHPWGTQERLPKFYLIKLPTVTVDQVNKFLASKKDFTDLNNVIEVGLREWKLDLNALTPNLLDQLMTTGTITVTKLNQFNGYMKLV